MIDALSELEALEQRYGLRPANDYRCHARLWNGKLCQHRIHPGFQKCPACGNWYTPIVLSIATEAILPTAGRLIIARDED